MEKLLFLAGALVVISAFLVVRETRALAQARTGAEALDRENRSLQRRLAEQDEDRRATDAVLSSMEDGVVLIGPVGEIRLMNAAAERFLGSKPVTASTLLPAALPAAVKGVASDGRTRNLEVETGIPNRWLRASVVPVGTDGSVLLVLRDVTDARRTDAIRRDFVTNASHELKTPVASIRAAAETIGVAAAEDPGVAARFAGQLERDSIRLSHIVGDLLDLSRLETGSELQDEVALDTLLEEERDRFDEAADLADVVLEISVSPVPTVRGSAKDLALLVGNLLDNAIRYTRAGARIDVDLSRDGRDVVLTVSDTGIGIPTRDLPRIFERFYRVDRARSRETGGTGLGLSIVRHVAENHGGTVSVESELGRGSTFTVRLPVSA